MFLHLDCRHYLGDRPCRFERLCEGCPHYAPMGPRVLIIKLGALGDVVRTAALLPGLTRAFPEPPHVTWLTSPAARPLVERMPGVDRVLTFTPETLYYLGLEHFDTILSLDKEPAPCAVAMRVPADKRLGIGLSRYGTVFPLNDEADYYFRLGLDNPEKFHVNQKSYPQLVYEALGWDYHGEPYTLIPTPDDLAYAQQVLEAAGAPAGTELIGINPGAGHVFAHKAWRPEGYAELIQRLQADRPAARIVLLGGNDEAELIADLADSANQNGNVTARIMAPGTHFPLGTFIALVGQMTVLIAGDTLAMHLAIAQRRPVVALFGPTCAQEIDLFGLGEKIVTPISCAPCYRRACDKSPHCMDLISAEAVHAAVQRQLARPPDQSRRPSID